VSRPRRVDFARVRRARERLDELAREHPELVGMGDAGVAQWERTLAEREGRTMGEETKQAAFRLPVSLLARLDAYAEQMGVEQPGMTFTRADALRVLLTRALDEHARPAPKSRRGK